jgi:hypothetical protein
MEQRFKVLTKVYVTKDIPSYMSHFEKGFYGIIQGSYAQICDGKDITSYSVYQLDGKNGKIVNCTAWYDEDQLKKVADRDSYNPDELIEDYILRS